MRLSPTVSARFHASYKIAESGCWEWQRGKMSSGYGSLYVGNNGGKDIREGAHRVSYELHIGPIPQGMFVCHHCDNKACCNPDHLFLGDQKANMRDAKVKGLLSRSEASRANNSAAMTPEVRRRIAQSVSDTKNAQREQMAVAAGFPASHYHCPDCDQWMAQDGFYKRINGQPRSTCKPCYNASMRKAYSTRRAA